MKKTSDPIERQDAIDAITEMGFQKTSTVKAILCRLETLPSAQPETCEYWDRESNICALHRPSAQPERKKGKWIVNILEYESKCSICGADETAFIHGTEMWYGIGKSKFCPNCGHPMEVEE